MIPANSSVSRARHRSGLSTRHDGQTGRRRTRSVPPVWARTIYHRLFCSSANTSFQRGNMAACTVHYADENRCDFTVLFVSKEEYRPPVSVAPNRTDAVPKRPGIRSRATLGKPWENRRAEFTRPVTKAPRVGTARARSLAVKNVT